MSEQWEAYIAELDEQPTYVTVDLALRALAPIAALPNLHWIRIPMRSTGEELAPAAAAVFAQVRELFAAAHARAVGTIAAADRRETYWYAPANFDPAAEIAAHFAASHLAGWSHHREADPTWQHYLQVLLPSDEDWRRAQIAKALVQLSERGDALDVVRLVEYRVRFAQRADLEAFLRQVEGAGYRRSQPEALVDGHWRAVVGVEHSLLLPEIDGHLRFLSTLAEAFGGRYEGWNTHAIHLRAPE